MKDNKPIKPPNPLLALIGGGTLAYLAWNFWAIDHTLIIIVFCVYMLIIIIGYDGATKHNQKLKRETLAEQRQSASVSQSIKSPSIVSFTPEGYPIAEGNYTPTSLLKAKMIYARELIKAKNYQEARQILIAIDHPTAQRWLRQLDKVEYHEDQYLSDTQPASSYPQQTSTRKLIPPPPSVDSSIKRDKQPSTSQPRSPAKAPKSHFLRNSVIVILAVFLCILFTNLFMINYFSSTPNYNPVQQQPTVDFSARMLAITPESISIVDPNNTGIPRNFLDRVRTAVSSYGYVQEYVGVMYTDSRFLTDVIVHLEETGNQYYSMARNVIEAIFRLYAKDIDIRTAGEVTISVEWNKDELPCALSSGMGYLAIQSINWDNADQASIFRAIDKDTYEDGIGRGDGLSGKSYSQVAWAPHPNTITQCYN